MVIAQDAQGAAAARPWVERAGGSYRALLDQYNYLGKAYNLKYVPVGILVDEVGRLGRAVGGVNIDRGEFRSQLEGWVESGVMPRQWKEADRREVARRMEAPELEADIRFRGAIAALTQGKREVAIARLKEAFKLDPQNWIIRKQLWAIETPEAFYAAEVDYAWQRERVKREEEGI